MRAQLDSNAAPLLRSVSSGLFHENLLPSGEIQLRECRFGIQLRNLKLFFFFYESACNIHNFHAYSLNDENIARGVNYNFPRVIISY